MLPPSPPPTPLPHPRAQPSREPPAPCMQDEPAHPAGGAHCADPDAASQQPGVSAEAGLRSHLHRGLAGRPLACCSAPRLFPPL